jgi:hypothetical protein
MQSLVRTDDLVKRLSDGALLVNEGVSPKLEPTSNLHGPEPAEMAKNPLVEGYHATPD